MSCPMLDRVQRDLLLVPEEPPRDTLGILVTHRILATASYALELHGWVHGPLMSLSNMQALTATARRFHDGGAGSVS